MPQKTQQKTFKSVKSPKRRINLTLPSATNSKLFQPATMSFVNIFELLCLNIESNVDTEVTTQIAVFQDKVGATLS